MRAAATAQDVSALRLTFALEAEEYFVEQFADLGYGKSYLARYLDHPLDQILTGEERDRLSKHLDQARKVRVPGSGLERIDKKQRNAFGQPREEPTKPGPGKGR